MEQDKKLMHPQAKHFTEQSLSFLTEQVTTKKRELNELGEIVIRNAKMELYIAQTEGVPVEDMSDVAQALYNNPDLRIESAFTGKVVYIENGKKTEFLDTSKGEETLVVRVNESTTNAGESKEVSEEFFDGTQDGNTAEQDESTGDSVEVYPLAVVEPIVKHFDKLKPAYTGDIATKIYKTSVLKPARELVKALIDEQVQIALNNLTTNAHAKPPVRTVTYKNSLGTFKNYSQISSVYEAVIRGSKFAQFKFDDLEDVAHKVATLDSLAYTIISNAEQFKEDNAQILSSKNLTAENIRQYYTALGKFESTKGSKTSGQAVIKAEISDDVANIMAK